MLKRSLISLLKARNSQHHVANFQRCCTLSRHEYLSPFLLNKRLQSSQEKTPDDSESFGSIAKNAGVEVFQVSKHETFSYDKDNFVKQRPDRTPDWYHKQCKKLIKEGKILESAKLLEKMMFEDRIYPTEPNFSVVMGALGRIGNVDLTFKLFKKIRDYNLTPSSVTYTSLYNAIANSKNKEDFEKGQRFYLGMKERKVRLNRINYNSIIRAYSHHGSFEQVIDILQDSVNAGIEPDVVTFQNILQHCKKNKENGFLHAVQIFRLVDALGIDLDGHFFTAFFNVTKYAGIGNIDTANKLLLKETPKPKDSKRFFTDNFRNFLWLKGQESQPLHVRLEEEKSRLIDESSAIEGILKNIGLEKPKILSLKATINEDENFTEIKRKETQQKLNGDNSDILMVESNANQLQTPTTSNINLLDTNTKYDGIVSLSECRFPGDRLNLVGGAEGIMQLMKSKGVKPNIIHLSMIMVIMQPNTDEENKLISIAETLKPDTAFFNLVLQKRIRSGRLKTITTVLNQMRNNEVGFNYATFCLLASCTLEGRYGLTLIDDFSNAGLCKDAEFFNHLLSGALRKLPNRDTGIVELEYWYFNKILETIINNDIKPTSKTLELFEKVTAIPMGYNRWENYNRKLERELKKFRDNYNQWLESGITVAGAKDKFKDFPKYKRELYNYAEF